MEKKLLLGYPFVKREINYGGLKFQTNKEIDKYRKEWRWV